MKVQRKFFEEILKGKIFQFKIFVRKLILSQKPEQSLFKARKVFCKSSESNDLARNISEFKAPLETF